MINATNSTILTFGNCSSYDVRFKKLACDTCSTCDRYFFPFVFFIDV